MREGDNKRKITELAAGDGKLIADTTREGMLCRREHLEELGWLFTGDAQVPKPNPRK